MSNISRSEYQKVCEENKKLKRDIKILVEEDFNSDEYKNTLLSYKEKFLKENKFNEILKKFYYEERIKKEIL